MPENKVHPNTPDEPAGTWRFSTHRLLSGMKIRKKLIVLHTAFSLGLGAILLIAIRPAMTKVIYGAEIDQAMGVMSRITTEIHNGRHIHAPSPWRIIRGEKVTNAVPDQILHLAQTNPGEAFPVPGDDFAAGVVCWLPETGEYLLVRARADRARETIRLVYLLLIATLVVGYGLVAAALELFVLPQHVYRPIRAMLDADHAVGIGDRKRELIPDHEIPADELGSIMRSRNEAILALRENERQLAHALDRLEHTAADLHKKNHLLETARKNLEGADRLASLGMMSAGIAHELNTPLAVVKGLVEKLNRDHSLSDTEIALLVRVVRRLETLSEGLLDFARARPPMNTRAMLDDLINEARTMVMIDRKEAIASRAVRVHAPEPSGIAIHCDPDRLVQVFVNLIRNAIDALVESSVPDPEVRFEIKLEQREGVPWVAVRVIDNGPGIEAELIDSLFEPFVSSRLDAQGTGLGLAVTNGIVREHGGLLVATNRVAEDTTGAIFEVLLPLNRGEDDTG